VGLSLCYDVRFPELYRIAALQGAGVVVVPAAFTAKTGPPHWEVLLRARAIENQVYVVAAAQHGVTRTTAAGKHGAANSTAAGPALAWHGHSLVVDPWGVVVAQASDGDAVVLADVDPGYRDHVRTVLPSLANRRPEAYRWP
jgi:predicted amidohydrolase